MSDQSKTALRILLAEDEAVNRMAVNHFLRKLGYSITTAANGREVLERLGEAPHDCVLMDIQMPVMDGLEATRAIRAGAVPGAAGIPIVALTAHAMQGDREAFLDAGMDRYLSKPLDLAELQRLLVELLGDE